MLVISRSIRSIHLFSFSRHSQTLRSNGKWYRSEKECVLYMSQTWIQSLPSVKEKGNQEVNKLIRLTHFPTGSDFCLAIEISFFCLPSLRNRKPKAGVHFNPSVMRPHACIHSRQQIQVEFTLWLYYAQIKKIQYGEVCRICGSVVHPIHVHERAMKIFSEFGIAYQGLLKELWHWELGPPGFNLPLFLAMVMKIAICFHGTPPIIKHAMLALSTKGGHCAD